MTEPLTPQAIETLAAGYVIGDLTLAEVELFEQLLAENPALAAEVDQLESTLNRVTYDLNSSVPPTHLKSAILSTTISQNLTSPRTSRPRPLRFPWRTLVGSAAALLILYLGIENYQLRQDQQLAQNINTLLQQSQTQLFSLKAVDATHTATGSFVVNLEQRQGILVVQNLPEPPANQVYRLWAIADGEKIPCGTLDINSEGKVLEQFWMPADFYDTGISGLFVTLEPSEFSRYPTGPAVLQSMVNTKS
ncbi:MAG TPA: anti-sigma factor [Crinalium sp.]|jgi:anti-sigma-K factor RskA